MSKTAVFTTAYPIDDSIAEDFFISLKSQSYQDFDIVFVNDGFSELSSITTKYDCLKSVILEPANSIAQNREKGIKYCKNQGYDYVIFCDFDDYFSNNRVECSLNLLKHYKIVVNEVIPFNKESSKGFESYISKRVNYLQEFSSDFLLDKNICGMSNTAIKTSIINDFTFPEDIIGIDWYFFNMLMIGNSIKCVFTNECATYYRQYESNALGICNLPCKSEIKKLVLSKRNHYGHLYKKFGILKQEFDNFSELCDEIEDDNKLEKYEIYIKKNHIKNAFWWENIIFKEKL